MLKKTYFFSLFIYFFTFYKPLHSQENLFNTAAEHWVDSIFKALTLEEKIAQLFILAAYSNKDANHMEEIRDMITQYGVGGLCFFQSSATEQVRLTNYYQHLSKVPLLIFMDAEWGVGMRLDSVVKMPFQIMLGAMRNAHIVYDYGRMVGRQFQRLGMHFNFAPVVDINSNTDNPIINYRSFGQDKEQVALMGAQYIQGLKQQGILGSIKHFPGHGDVDIDSHYDLPLIRKNFEQLSELELYPFRYAIEHTPIAGVMTAHLNLSKIMQDKKTPSSISSRIIKDLLIGNMGFQGLILTDALNMYAFRKYIEDDIASVIALRAGNDMLNIVDNVAFSIKSIRDEALKDINFQHNIFKKVKKVLHVKYLCHLYTPPPTISTRNLLYDLNEYERSNLARDISDNAITLVKLDNPRFFSRLQSGKQSLLYIAIGEEKHNKLSYILRQHFNCNVELLNINASKSAIKRIYDMYKNKHPIVLIGMHHYGSSVKKNYNFTATTKLLLKKFSKFPDRMTLLFGNPYTIKNFLSQPNIMVCYNDANETHSAVATILMGKQFPKGQLPFSVENIPLGSGITSFDLNIKFSIEKNKHNNLTRNIDKIVNEGLMQKAFPGANVLVLHKGKVIYENSFGRYTYDIHSPEVTQETIYDVASVTKGFATTLAIMKLYEEGKLKLTDKISTHLPLLKNTNKARLTIQDALLHQTGLPAWLPYHKYTLQPDLQPPPYKNTQQDFYQIAVAPHLFMHKAWQDSLINALIQVPLGPSKYQYSDIGFIYLGWMIESITKTRLDEYLRRHIYDKIGTLTTFFNPYDKIPLSHIAPTEADSTFRKTLVHGYVHDYIATMLGGIAGHAGLFSTARDLALITQLLLNKGQLHNLILFNKATISLFTQYATPNSRRGLGFDKPERTKERKYPSPYASDLAFGHSGFTGTSVWVDPQYDLSVIFLSNRVYPNVNNNLIRKLKIRERILDTCYEYIHSLSQ